MDVKQLILLNDLAKKDGSATPHKRDIFNKLLEHKDKTLAGLHGPRGAGKTVLLKQLLANTPDGFYVSLDTLERTTNVFELVLSLHQDYRFQTFFLDEIHFIEDINKYLKILFDNLNIRIFFTSSIALKLIESAHDLSRRVKIFSIDYFSFSEFLRFNKYPTPPALSWNDILSKNFRSAHSESLPYLQAYLRGGNIPISLEVKDVLESLQRNLEKIINSDIPKLKSLKVDELPIIMNAFRFIARAPGGDLNPNTIAKNLKITRYKALQYLELLEAGFILKLVLPHGTEVTREPKILCKVPYRLLECEYDDCIGGLREDFAVHCMLQAGLKIKYLKSKRGAKTPDFLVTDSDGTKSIVEIGGANKSYSQFKGISEKHTKMVFGDHADLSKNTLPLGLLGFLSERE